MKATKPNGEFNAILPVHVHRTTFAAWAPCCTASQFAKNALNRDTHQISPAMATIGSDDTVVCTHSSLHTNSTCLLTRIQMAKTTDNFVFIQGAGRGFHASNVKHVLVVFECIVTGDGGCCSWPILQIVQFEVACGEDSFSSIRFGCLALALNIFFFCGWKMLQKW